MAPRLATAQENEEWDPYAIPRSGPVDYVEFQTEHANGRRFVNQFGEDVRYVPAWKKFLVYDDKRWDVDSGAEVERLAKLVADNVWDEVKELLPNSDPATVTRMIAFARATASSRGVQATLAMVRSELGIVTNHTVLDTDPFLFNCQNGTLDLRTGELRPHRREDYLTKISPVTFDASADCPLWRGVIDEILAGDSELISWLRRFFGLCLTGMTTEHILAFFYGSGANGKTTVVETLLALLGSDYSMKAMPDLLMSKANDSHPVERADLFRMRFVCCNEIDQGRRLNESLTKDLTGGDKIRARRLYENPWEFSPTHKLLICGNHKPIIRGQDHGIWRRLKLVPFLVTIPPERQDKDLRDKLLAELPGILNWCIIGCLDWQQNGLGQTEAIDLATADYRSEQDVVGAFISECCCELPTAKVKAGDLYTAFEAWSKRTGEPHLGSRTFGEQVSQRFERKISNGKWYIGVGIVEQSTTF